MKIWILGLVIFLVIDLLLVLWISFKRSRGKKMGSKEMNYIHAHWMRIIDSFEFDSRHAILDADKLLDYALKVHGYEGSVADKLKKAKFRFSDLNGIWSAHKLRNKVAHELGDIPKLQAKMALKQFKKGLNDLGAGL